MLQNMSCWPSASAWGPSTPLSAALVPTATNPGVSMGPWGVWILPTRAPDLEDLQGGEQERGWGGGGEYGGAARSRRLPTGIQILGPSRRQAMEPLAA